MASPPPPLTSVVQRCVANQDPRAWVELVQRLQPLLARIAYRVVTEWGLRPGVAEIDDVIQETYLKLAANDAAVLRRIPADTEQSAAAYIRVVAANCAHDYLKAKHAAKRGLDRTANAGESLETLAGTLESHRIERDVLIDQVDAALQANRRERSIFWLYYRQGYTAKEISFLPGCNLGSKGVESLIFRLTAAVRKALAKPRTITDDFAEGNSASESL